MNAGRDTHLTTTSSRRSRGGGRTARRLAAVTLAAATLLGIAGPAAAGPTKAPNQATIVQTGLEVGGTYARLQWTANVASTVIQIDPTPPKLINGKWDFTDSQESDTVAKEGGGFEYLAGPLSTDTPYYVILTTPPSGNLAMTQVKGQFRTKVRTHAIVTFNEIHVIDDSDTWSKGDLWWYFDTAHSDWSDGWHRPASDGDTFAVDYKGNGPYVKSVSGAWGPSIEVTLQGADDDEAWNHFGCGLLDKWIGDPHQGSNECTDTAFAQMNVMFPTYYFEGSPKAFTMTVGHSPALRFSVSGTVQAVYA